MMFAPYLSRWNLTPDGDAIHTPSSALLPVVCDGAPAMLKIATVDEERRGALLMEWWNGNGSARVLAHDGGAVLMERATERQSLVDLVKAGRDDDASRIICAVAAKLHAPRNEAPPELPSLNEWFRELEPAAAKVGGILIRAAETGWELLNNPQEPVVLHGDIHHGNILNFGRRGWLAIDPKSLVGERGFDFANLFCNPDLETAAFPRRLARQSYIVAEAAGLERKRLLQWILAYAGLSAAWSLGENRDPKRSLVVAEIAASELSKGV